MPLSYASVTEYCIVDEEDIFIPDSCGNSNCQCPGVSDKGFLAESPSLLEVSLIRQSFYGRNFMTESPQISFSLSVWLHWGLSPYHMNFGGHIQTQQFSSIELWKHLNVNSLRLTTSALKHQCHALSVVKTLWNIEGLFVSGTQHI